METEFRPDLGDVAEVAGPAFSPVQAVAAIAVGVVSLLISGLLSLLLGALAAEHRLSAAGIGQLAMIEALSTGAVTGLAGAFLPARGLRFITAAAAVGLAAANLLTVGASGAALIAARFGAGVCEGLLLWVSIGMIARTAIPERWAGVLFTAYPVAQLALAAGFTSVILPHFGSDGAYRALAGASLVAVLVSPLLARNYGPMPGQAPGTSGAPPPRGWAALGATLLFTASLAATSLYTLPLAQQAGLAVAVGREAVTASLACQILGGGVAIALAGRVHYLTVFAVALVSYLGIWLTLGSAPPAWAFIGVSALGGLAGQVCGPFLVPMTIAADPSRRAALQSGGTQLLAGALGPLLASRAVSDQDVRGVLVLGAVLLSMATAGFFAVSRRPKPSAGPTV